MNPETLRDLIARGLNLTEAESAIDSLEHLSRNQLYDLCHAAGVVGIRPHDGRGHITRKLALALTVRARSVERNEC